jgi:hypothetical protein
MRLLKLKSPAQEISQQSDSCSDGHQVLLFADNKFVDIRDETVGGLLHFFD